MNENQKHSPRLDLLLLRDAEHAAEDGDGAGAGAARPQRRDGPPPPLPDEVRPWKAPNNTLAARLISCWTCDQSISCLRVPLHKKSASGKHSRPGPASPSDI